MSGFLGLGAKEQRIGDRLPYAHLYNDHTVTLRDGSLMQAIYIDGFGFETADTTDLNSLHALRESALRAIGDSRLVLHHHILRRKVSVSTSGSFDDPVATHIDERWQARLSSRELFVNDLFITILRRPARGKAGLAEALGNLFGGKSGTDREGLGAELRELDAARDALMAALGRYGPRLLGGYDSRDGRCSEPLELLSALFHGEMRPVLRPDPLARDDAGHYIPYQRLSVGVDALELKSAGASKSFGAMISVKEYPPQAAPGMLDALLHLPYEMTLSQSFQFVDRQIGLERVNLALRRLRAADDDGITLRAGLMNAKDELASGQTALGEHHLTVLVRAPGLSQLDQAAAQVASTLADTGAVSVREDINLEPAFWAQFPGNEAYIARKALISVSAFAGMASLHGFALGRATGNHWGEAITVLETTAATPYFFNFHSGDLGNFTLIGPSGSGKTVVLNFLAAQAQKAKPRTVIFDKDRGSELFVRAIGGHYAALRAGEPTGFNPLQLPDNAINRAFLRDLISRLISGDGPALAPEDEAILTEAIDAMYAQAPAYRRLRYFQELLGGLRRPSHTDLAARLAPWCGRGEWAWLFDNEADQLDLSARVLGFDMTQFLDTPVLRTPIMMYLFHRIEERLDGTPAMILIDEGWKALDDESFSARIRDWMKTLRKRNAILGFGTQSASDALDSRIASAIIEQAATQIFMANPRARMEDYGDGFGLSEHEVGLVRALPPHAHAFLVKHGNHSVVARLDLSAMPDLLNILSGRESSVRKLDELRATVGDAPEAWWPEIAGTPWPGNVTRQKLKVTA
ncbi:VirB4 family type IV secretion/conjugal transfer ATPase [Asticcacaulis sp. YBE204]|uniref:VirB4 family type IV secretion/conjugal transfer ATPase n=1 Tax=Asticcacaulis sp. YBE204 TaxID=1282363 RepID=UPI0003C3BE82|nr:VirB4 family type IV secretion/conjugal transfer ATPase [Asticcacaulis sp. YBE204]ESQ78381.1 type VI secretion protein [Asticcacaulis sp. YBE204]